MGRMLVDSISFISLLGEVRLVLGSTRLVLTMKSAFTKKVIDCKKLRSCVIQIHVQFFLEKKIFSRFEGGYYEQRFVLRKTLLLLSYVFPVLLLVF